MKNLLIISTFLVYIFWTSCEEPPPVYEVEPQYDCINITQDKKYNKDLIVKDYLGENWIRLNISSDNPELLNSIDEKTFGITSRNKSSKNKTETQVSNNSESVPNNGNIVLVTILEQYCKYPGKEAVLNVTKQASLYRNTLVELWFTTNCGWGIDITSDDLSYFYVTEYNKECPQNHGCNFETFSYINHYYTGYYYGVKTYIRTWFIEGHTYTLFVSQQ